MSKKHSTTREYLEALLIAGLFLGFTNTFVIKTFYIPSASMEATLLIGDHLFVNRFIYGAAPAAPERWLLPVRPIARGDIVIFRSPERPRVDMVKRCVGLPGDVIEIANKDLFVNGVWVDDANYTWHRDARIYSNGPRLPEPFRQRDNFGPFTVPEGHFFFLGDNRDQSYDSRFWGPVPAAFVKGRAFLIYWSFGGETSDGTWRGWVHKIGQLTRTALGFFTQSRWSRTFHLIR
ncbi:MAG: signal peptidase I [Thermoanaerobaculia bacterium]